MTDSIASAVLTRWNMESGEVEDRATMDIPGRIPPLGAPPDPPGHEEYTSSSSQSGGPGQSLRFKLNAASQPNLGNPPGAALSSSQTHDRIETSPQTSGEDPNVLKATEALRSQSWNPRSQALATAGVSPVPGEESASSNPSPVPDPPPFLPPGSALLQPPRASNSTVLPPLSSLPPPPQREPSNLNRGSDPTPAPPTSLYSSGQGLAPLAAASFSTTQAAQALLAQRPSSRLSPVPPDVERLDVLDLTEVADGCEDEGPRPSNPAEPPELSPTSSLRPVVSKGRENTDTAVEFALPSQVDQDTLSTADKTPRHLIGNLQDKTSAGIGPGIYRLRSNFPTAATSAASPSGNGIGFASPRPPIQPSPATAGGHGGGLLMMPPLHKMERDMGPPSGPYDMPSTISVKPSPTQPISSMPNSAAAMLPAQTPSANATANPNQMQQQGVGRKERRGSVYHQVITLFQPFAPRRLLKRLQTVATDAAQQGNMTTAVSSPTLNQLGLSVPGSAKDSQAGPSSAVPRDTSMARSMRVSIDQSLIQRAVTSSRSGQEPMAQPSSATAAQQQQQQGNRGGPAGPSNAPVPLSHSGQLEPESEMVHGAMLIIDVSGFTALTEKLSQDEGRMLSGEHLIACLNDYFHKLYGIIEENGGDVIKFAGDAMIVLFDAGGSSEEKLEEASGRAVTAAYRAVSELGEVRMLPTGKVKPVVERTYVHVQRNDSVHRPSKPVAKDGQGSVHGASLYQQHELGATSTVPRVSKPEEAVNAEQGAHNATSAPMRNFLGARRPGRNSVEAIIPGWRSGNPSAPMTSTAGIISAVLTGGGQAKNVLAGPVVPEVSIREDGAYSRAPSAHSQAGEGRSTSVTSQTSERRPISMAEMVRAEGELPSGTEASNSGSVSGPIKRTPTMSGPAKKSVGIIDKPTQVAVYQHDATFSSDTGTAAQAAAEAAAMAAHEQPGLEGGTSAADVGLPYAHSSPPKTDSSKGEDYSQSGDLDSSIEIDMRRGAKGARSKSVGGFGRFMAFMGRIFTSFSAGRNPHSVQHVGSGRYTASATNMTNPKRTSLKSQVSDNKERESDSVYMQSRPSVAKDMTVTVGRKNQPSIGYLDAQGQPISAAQHARAASMNPRLTSGVGQPLQPLETLQQQQHLQAPRAAPPAPEANVPMDAEEFRLSIKVMCAVGKLYTYHVGYGDTVDSATGQKTTGRWEFFIGDGPSRLEETPDIRPPMQQLIDLEPFAEKKKVVISQEVNTLLADFLETLVLGEGKAYLLGDDVDLDILPRGSTMPNLLENKIPALPGAVATSHYLESIKAHVPRCVSASIRDGHREFASEVRYCSCAFFGFPGLLDGCSSSADAVSRIQKAFENVDKAMNIYEGEFLQFRCDEKGFLAVCCFGLMGKTHRDDAMRALHSALSVTNRMEKVGLKACCGVTTGILLCAFVGSTDRCEYTIFGDAINTSARLMVKSKARTGGFSILCDEVTQRLCMGQARFEEVQGIKLKGKAEGTKVFGVETLLKSNKGGEEAGPSDGGGRREVATFVGRENIVEQVMSTISDVIHGNSLSDLVIISGEVGLGKSRLLQHTLEETRNRFGDQAICGTIVAEATGGGHVLAPWKRLLRSFVRQMEGRSDYDDDDDMGDEEGFRVEDITQQLHRMNPNAVADSLDSAPSTDKPKPYQATSFMSRSVAYGISEERPYDTGEHEHDASNDNLGGTGNGEGGHALQANGHARPAANPESASSAHHPLAPQGSLMGRRLSVEVAGGGSKASRMRQKSGILASRTVSQKFVGSPTPSAMDAQDREHLSRPSFSRSQSLSKMAIFRSLSKKSSLGPGDGRTPLQIPTTGGSFHFSSREKGLMAETPDADPTDQSFMTRTLQKMHVDRRDFYQWLNAKGAGNAEGGNMANTPLPGGLSINVAQSSSAWGGMGSPIPPSKGRKGSVTAAQQQALDPKRSGIFSSETFNPPGSSRDGRTSLKGNPSLKVEIPASPRHLTVAANFGVTGGPDSATAQQPPTNRIRRNSLLAKQEIVRQLSRSNLKDASKEASINGLGVAGRALSFTPKQGGPAGGQRRRSLTTATPKPYDDRDDFRLVVNFIKELIGIRGCVVITVDELDRLDSLSVELLNYLLDVIPQGLVAIASISALALRDLPRHVNELFRAHGPNILEMGLMSKEETGRFIDAVLGIEKGTPVAGSLVAGDPTLHEYIYERTHGHPLHTEQLLLLIKQSLDQDVSMEDLNYMLNKSISIAAVILKRIDELRPGSQLTLKVASVLGNRIELSLLQKIHPLVMSEAALQAQLTQLVQMNFLVRDVQEGVYRFSSELVREVCYGLIPVVQRGSIHQSIAFALQEALDAQGVDVPSAAIAYHLVKSLTNLDETAQYRARQAIDQLEQAAFEALEQHSFQEALGFLNDMEGILNHPVLAAPSSMFTSQIMNENLDDMSFKRAIASLGIAEALLGLHSWNEAQEKLEVALDLLNHADVLEKRSWSIGKLFGQKRSGGRNVRIAPELARRTGENEMDLEELQIVVKVLELYLDLRSLLHNELITDFEGLANPDDDLDELRNEYKKEMAKVKMVLKNLGSLLRREANSKKRPLPYDIRERVLLAVSCI